MAEILPDLVSSLSQPRRRTRRGLLLGGTLCVFIALASPESGFDWEETQRRGIDVLIAVDVSRSMLARDVQPDRLRRAKLAVNDLVEQLGGDRVGLVAFAGSAFLQCPLTLDHAAFQRSLDALSTEIITAPGSNLASALDVAREALAGQTKNVKLLILFSDGEDLRGGAVAAAERAAADDIKVFTVGVGTPAGELIPQTTGAAAGAFVKDRDGRIVKSRLDEATLKRVARITDGFYVPLGARAEGVNEIIERALAPLPRAELASRMRRIPRNRFQWPLALAIVLFCLEPLVSERRRSGGTTPSDRIASGIIALLLLLGFSASPALSASAEMASLHYENQDYGAAAREFHKLTEESDDPRLDLNLGASSFRDGQFADAAAAYARALRTDDDSLRQQAFYDLGNAHYRLGQEARPNNPQQAASAWENSIAAYEEALALDDTDEDAIFNRDLVKRKLEELKSEMEQQPSSDEDEDREEPEPQDQEEQEESESEQNQDNQGQKQESQDESPKPRDAPPNEEETPSEPQENQKSEQESQAESEEKRPEESGAGEQDPDPSNAQETAPSENSVDHPDALTPQEAQELLDSLEGDQAFLPMAPLMQSGSADPDDPRNW